MKRPNIKIDLHFERASNRRVRVEAHTTTVPGNTQSFGGILHPRMDKKVGNHALHNNEMEILLRVGKITKDLREK